MRKKLLITFLFINLFSIGILNAKIENKIVVKVGSELITSFEVKNKILSTLIVANNQINQENINKIKSKVLSDLINTKLKKNELKNLNLKIDKKRIDNYLNQLTSNNINSLKNKFNNFNLDFELFIENIETEFKWQQFIYSKYANKIEIDENSITNEIDKILKNELTTKEVNISEIQILNNDDESDKKIISEITNEINKNGFENTALTFSISNTASEKGSLGWINTKTLSSEIFKIINLMKPGDVSSPIIKQNTILFLKLNEERIVSSTDLDKEQLKGRLMQQKQNEIFNLYSMSHLSTIKNKYLVEYK